MFTRLKSVLVNQFADVVIMGKTFDYITNILSFPVISFT